jgi:hypothetical protein
LTLIEPKRLELEEVEQQLATRREEMADLSQRRADSEARLEELERVFRRRESDLQEMQEQAEKAREQREQEGQALNEITAQLRKLEVTHQEKSAELRQADSNLARLRQELESSRAEKEELRATRDSLNAEVVMLEQRKAELERTKAFLEGYIGQSRTERDKQEQEALADLKRVPACLTEANRTKDRGRVQERDALDGLKQYLSELGLQFPDRILNAFHTCMKINDLSPLTVLAGISGTGKSELPRRYAEGMGIHFLQMAVQPRWDSPQDLFGFYNYLEHRYIATDLARALTHLDSHNHPDLAEQWRNHMLLVLLDEMNLARVEYYFSEFLSRLEVRKSVNPDDHASRLDSEVQLDIGGSKETFNLFVGRNVLFAGTMNEDESTQSLSDKVIDRANVLRFGRPKTLADTQPRQEIPRSDRYLSHKTWSSWINSLDTPDTLDTQSLKTLRHWITKLNDALAGLERPFAHRINQAIQLYCINYPGDRHSRLRDAFADQLEQRIMPKLRGIDTTEFQDPLGELHALIEELGDQSLAEAMQAGRERPLFVWQGVDRDG